MNDTFSTEGNLSYLMVARRALFSPLGKTRARTRGTLFSPLPTVHHRAVLRRCRRTAPSVWKFENELMKCSNWAVKMEAVFNFPIISFVSLKYPKTGDKNQRFQGKLKSGKFRGSRTDDCFFLFIHFYSNCAPISPVLGILAPGFLDQKIIGICCSECNYKT